MPADAARLGAAILSALDNYSINHPAERAPMAQAIADAVVIEATQGFVYPVGSLYISENPTSPDIVLGYGTWVAIPGNFYLTSK